MYTIIGNPRARTRRVIWMLEEVGADYQIVNAPPGSDTILTHNPSGKMPVLLDGEDAVTDSIAAITYLADKHGALTATPGTLARARQDGMLHFALDEIEGALWTFAKNSFIYPEDLRVPEIERASRHDLTRAFETLATRIGAQPFATGAEFSIADLVMGHLAGWLSRSPFAALPSEEVAAYFERCRDRDALRRAEARIDREFPQ